MILVNKIVNSLLQSNTYFVYDSDSKDSIIVDPGSDFEAILEFINNNNLNVLAVLLTHGHFDHAFSCKNLQELGYKVYISEDDEEMCNDNFKNCAILCGVDFKGFVPDSLINKADSSLSIGKFNIKILHVPGHTKGGLAFVINNHIFTGDTLFNNGYGRTDMYGGDDKSILKSIKMLMNYKNNNYVINVGHDY